MGGAGRSLLQQTIAGGCASGAIDFSALAREARNAKRAANVTRASLLPTHDTGREVRTVHFNLEHEDVDEEDLWWQMPLEEEQVVAGEEQVGRMLPRQASAASVSQDDAAPPHRKSSVRFQTDDDEYDYVKATPAPPRQALKGRHAPVTRASLLPIEDRGSEVWRAAEHPFRLQLQPMEVDDDDDDGGGGGDGGGGVWGRPLFEDERADGAARSAPRPPRNPPPPPFMHRGSSVETSEQRDRRYQKATARALGDISSTDAAMTLLESQVAKLESVVSVDAAVIEASDIDETARQVAAHRARRPQDERRCSSLLARLAALGTRHAEGEAATPEARAVETTATRASVAAGAGAGAGALPCRTRGPLWKKGGGMGGRRNWSLRYFDLDLEAGVLRYYSDAQYLQFKGLARITLATRVNRHADYKPDYWGGSK